VNRDGPALFLSAAGITAPHDWRRLAVAIGADPWGPVAQQVLEAVEMSRPCGAGELLTSVIDDARRYAVDAERRQAPAEGK
jgi:hypothetical protein